MFAYKDFDLFSSLKLVVRVLKPILSVHLSVVSNSFRIKVEVPYTLINVKNGFTICNIALRILDIHDFISDMVLLHTKNKTVSLKVANSVVHVYKDEGMSSTFRIH